MNKKIWIILLVVFTNFLVWITFADILTHGIHSVERCVKIVNPHEISWYKLVMWRYGFAHGSELYKVYDVEENKCLPTFYQWWSSWSDEFLYLIDENIDISTLNDLSSIDFENKLWKYFKLDEIDINWESLDNLNPVLNENLTYKIVKIWESYRLKLIKKSVGVGTSNLKENVPTSSTVIFSIIIWIISWVLTIVIETIILFIIAKLFRKKIHIPNWRLFLMWVIASTVTLPLLRFVLPLFIGYGVRYVVIWEILVTFIEVFILKYWLKISRWKAILASIICNLSSFVIWEAINFFLLPF